MIYITGDTHGRFERLSSRRCPAGPGDFVMICGDFGGLWDGSREENYWLRWLSEKPFTVLFVDGNHENFDMLGALPLCDWNGGSARRVADNIIWLCRGQVYEIDGISFFTMGGASSHDMEGGVLYPDDADFETKRRRLNKLHVRYRVEHTSWWREELPSDEEMALGEQSLARAGNRVDVIITHCAPSSVQDMIGGAYAHDVLTDYLDRIRASCAFRAWFFGHYHRELSFDGRFFSPGERLLPLTDFL